MAQGRPGTGFYCVMRNKTRTAYHKAVKYINKNKEYIKRCNFLNASLQGDKNLFKEIRKTKQNNKIVSNCIDGLQDNGHIANHFASKYDKLFNLPESAYNCQNYDDLCCTIRNKIMSDHDSDRCIVSVDEIITAIRGMKYNKRDGIYEMSTNCFKEAPSELYIHLSFLFNILMNHGYIPSKIVNCTMIP